MGALATAVRIRHDLHTKLLEARAQTDEVFRVVREEAIYDRPIPERHRIIFYVGHVEAFDWNLLAGRAFGLRSCQRTRRQIGRPAKKSSVTTGGYARNWTTRSSMPWNGPRKGIRS